MNILDTTLRAAAVAVLLHAVWIAPNASLTEPQSAPGAEEVTSGGRFRISYEKPQPITPGRVLDYKIVLHSASHLFKEGHRIALQVHSSWFPRIDRNPQTFLPNILKASPGDFKTRAHAVFHTSAYLSAISMRVVSPAR
jgi:predicted acyl esterase